jgi:beta-glucosidase
MIDSTEEKFFWGASTASHQVEGGTKNQWSEWELKNSKRLANSSKRRLSKLKNWESIKTRAHDPDNYISGKGVDHYNLYEKDFDLAKQLYLNSLRFSIEWSRIEPEPGVWDENEIDHYKKYIKAMKVRGITPFLNIWHWTIPIWFAELGGFEKSDNLKFFKRFIEKLSQELIEDVDYVMILNETNVYSTFSYLSRQWPPAGRSFSKYFKVNLNLVKAYKIAYLSFKAVKPTIQIGFAQNLAETRPSNKYNPISNISVKLIDYYWNWWFIDRVVAETDFIGINYYNTQYVNFLKIKAPTEPMSDLGWYMNPSGIFELATKVWNRYSKPIIISENGVADELDQYREWWIRETVESINKLKAQNVAIFGYLHWSLLDNFEWAYGWWPKFGLIKVDRENMNRTIKKSAKSYSEIIRKI